MPCPKCHNVFIDEQPISSGTKRYICPICGLQDMMFFVKGRWINQLENMERLKRYFICKDCGETAHDYRNTHKGHSATLCNPCSDKRSAYRSIEDYLRRRNDSQACEEEEGEKEETYLGG